MAPTDPAVDPYRLARFVEAQHPVLDAVLAELAAGRKRSHWMWFVFPQLAGLGTSAMARHYAIGSVAEAQAYLAHPLLGPRLLQCCGLLLQLPPRPIRDILGSPDDMKLHSSATLFATADPAQPVFGQVLDRFFGGAPDARTLQLLATR